MTGDYTPSPATNGLREAVEALQRLHQIGETRRDLISDEDWEWFCNHPLRLAHDHPIGWSGALGPVADYLETFARPAPLSEAAPTFDAVAHICTSCAQSDPTTADAVEQPDEDGPECETCGKTTCPDADLPGFSAPANCEYATIYEALRAAKDCDYGCARDLTNQDVRREVVPVVERMIAARVAEADPRGSARVEWGVRTVVEGDSWDSAEGSKALAELRRDSLTDWLTRGDGPHGFANGRRFIAAHLVHRTVTTYDTTFGEWEVSE